MGVHGLATYLRDNLRALSSSLVLSHEQSKYKSALPLVVDGWSFIYELHNQSRLSWVYGGELGEFRDLVIRVTRAWISVGWKPYFVFDGPYRSSKIVTCSNRMTQSVAQPSLLFFRTSPLSRVTPRFLRENSILPPLCYAATLDALRSVSDAVEIYLADDEGDPFAVELAGRLKGYVTGQDSDYVILNSEGYAGYIPMDQMVWGVNSHRDREECQSQDDNGFVVAQKGKARDAFNRGIIPPEINDELSLNCLVFTPHTLASHFQISLSLLPLLASLIGNDFTAERLPTNKLFFDRNMTPSQRMARVASVLKSVSAVATGTSTNRRIRHQITNVVEFVGLTVESLLIRPTSVRSGEMENIVEKTVDATLQYTIPKNQDFGDGSITPCVLHDVNSCPLVGHLFRPTSGHLTENENEARKEISFLYISAYRHTHFSPGLMDVLSTGTAWPDSFLENPDLETVSRSLGRPIREWVYALLDDGIGLMEHDAGLENESGDTSADEVSDDDEIIDVIEEDSDEDPGPGNPLAPLQGALKELTIGTTPPSTSSRTTVVSRSMRHKYVDEYVRRGTRHAKEPVSVPSLATLLSSHGINTNIGNRPNIRPIQLQDENLRLTVFLRFLGSDTHLVKTLPSEYLMAVVSLRWIVNRLAVRADESRHNAEREKEKWTVREARAFLASFSWPGGAAVEPTSPPLENRRIQLTAQVLATFDAVEMLSQVLLLTDRVPNPATFFSGKAFHHRLADGDLPDAHIPPVLWDAFVDDLDGVFAHEKDWKKKRDRKTKGNRASPAHGQTVRGVGGQSMFDVLSALNEGV
ncbi:PIN domain-like protein [Russula earlei]|uniref:PIN domain-like protein n=1 Tax=Russula earlei TaxID=71964 RepID=A0ACC0U5N3_9AGAM|nr:PIN domain-like protein [Russula earlei]